MADTAAPRPTETLTADETRAWSFALDRVVRRYWRGDWPYTFSDEEGAAHEGSPHFGTCLGAAFDLIEQLQKRNVDFALFAPSGNCATWTARAGRFAISHQRAESAIAFAALYALRRLAGDLNSPHRTLRTHG